MCSVFMRVSFYCLVVECQGVVQLIASTCVIIIICSIEPSVTQE
jgi:hypothetical protein